MTVCPFAQKMPIKQPVAKYIGGPFRIVHHTTQTTDLKATIAGYEAEKTRPHFTVTAEGIFQHLDTDLCALTEASRST